MFFWTGDHQQLRPSTVSHFMAKEYKLEVSFFERLARDGHPVSLLREQHRMRPHISSVVSKLFYPDLKDHASVANKPEAIPGMGHGIFLLKHDCPEDAGSVALSKSRY